MPKPAEPYYPPDSELASDPSKFEWTYRCSVCGHGAHLMACSLAVASGPLHPDGELARHDDVTDTELAEDSIECSKHPAPEGVVERRVDGEWRRWWSCERCNGTGNEGKLSMGRFIPCSASGYEGSKRHYGWLVPSPVGDMPLSVACRHA